MPSESKTENKFLSVERSTTWEKTAALTLWILEAAENFVLLGSALPDNTKVYVIAPDIKIEQIDPFHRPRLAHPEPAADFKMEVIEERTTA